jgi:hypothetical protein
MAHYAKVDQGKVINVIVAEPEFFDTFIDSSPGEWIQTSYNTHRGVHKNGGTPLRGNFASIGGVYDRERDVFYAQRPFASWILNTNTWSWEAPVAMPTEGKYQWNESTKSWVVVE